MRNVAIRRPSRAVLLGAVVAPLYLLLGSPSGATPSFVRMTTEAGLDAPSASLGAYGPGVAAFDFENDGDIDLFVPNDLSGHKLYLNNGDGSFSDIAPSLGLDFVTELPPQEDQLNPFETDPTAMMPSFVDTDNDGDLDFFLTNWISYNRFFENVDGTYVDRTHTSGLGVVGHSATAAWGDYDGDGFLDVYIADWGGKDRLFRNNGDNSWSDVSEPFGLYEGMENQDRAAWSAIWFDHNGDGAPDLYVGNDYGQPNQLYINEGNRFTDRSRTFFPELQDPSRTVFENNATMGQALGDFDRDGDYDLFVANSLINDLYERRGNEYHDLMEDPESPGAIRNSLKNNDIGWDCEWTDVDNDGWIDLFLVNGYIRLCLYDDPFNPDCSSEGQPEQPNLMWMNDGGDGFTRVTDVAGLSNTDWGKAAVWVDFDDDGRVDVFVTDSADASDPDTHDIWRNVTENTGHYLKVRLRGDRSNRDAIGAELRARIGDVTLLRGRRSSTGFLSQDGPDVHFGLGDATVVDQLEILWPSGQLDILYDVPVDQTLYLRETRTGSAVPNLPRPVLSGRTVDDGVLVRWSVEAGSRFDRFLVQRTREGRPGGTIATLDGATVEFLDTAVEPGATYTYRVIGERDGDRVESATVVLTAPFVARTLGVQPASPNPFNPRTTLRYRLPTDVDTARLMLVDVRGRRVRDFEPTGFGTWQTIVWDGTDDGGRPVASGSYRFVVEAGSRIESTSLTLLR